MADIQKMLNDAKGVLGKLLNRTDINVEELKREIIAYRSFIQEMLEVMNEQNRSGLEHAIVLRKTKGVFDFVEPELRGEFRIGSVVTIQPDSAFAKVVSIQETGSGVIESFDPEGQIGWALVNFNGKKKPLRYGNPSVDNGTCDLLLLSQPILVASERETLTLALSGRVIEQVHVTGITVEVGETVLVSQQTGHILSKVESITTGVIATVEEVLETDQLVVAVNGERRVVAQISALKGKYERGVRVSLDSSLHAAIAILPRSKSIAISDDIDPVEWDDIIGLEDAKKEAKLILSEIKHAELYREYKAKTSGGILLIGPPGNGKTYFGKAIATEISKSFKDANGEINGFMYIKATEILDMYVGEAPRKVRDLFAKAEEFFRTTGRKAIMFVDEIDAVIVARGTSKGDSGSSDKLTNAFLTEMGGIQNSYAFVIGATNRPDLLDAAAMRPGRFDKKIYVGRPEAKDVPEFFTMYLKKKPLATGLVLADVVAQATELYCSDNYCLYELIGSPATGNTPACENKKLRLLEIGSGAMIEGLVEDAVKRAITRDIATAINSGDKPVPTGLTLEDITAAFDALYAEQKRLNHEEVISEYADMANVSYIDVKKIK